MRKFLLALFVGLCSLTNLFAQPNIVAKFVARSHSFQSTTLPYRLFIPDNYNPTKKYPLVLALHGSGNRGSDNLQHIQSTRLATSWADPVNQTQYPCFVVAPQCPLNQSWNVEPIAATVSDLLDSLTREFNIDLNRQYITGLSMGGYGTWDMITRFPNRFAAAIPMSAGCGIRLRPPKLLTSPSGIFMARWMTPFR
jgi:predicted peptidase